METLSLILLIVSSLFGLAALIVAVVCLVKIVTLSSKGDTRGPLIELGGKVSSISERLDRVTSSVHRDMSEGLERVNTSQREGLRTVSLQTENRVGGLEKSLSASNERLETRVQDLSRSTGENLEKIRSSTEAGLKELNQVNDQKLEKIEQTVTGANEKLENKMTEMTKTVSESLDKIRLTTESSLKELNRSNEEKLDKIEQTVAEKLDKTLSERVSESFKRVSEQLEQVYKGLGEMQTLVSDVGSLKTMLSNVKLRGEFGETQLSRILEQLLTPEQYAENVITKKTGRDPVEFAVRIPSKDPNAEFLWLPIDAKFPLDIYNALTEAYETGEKTEIDNARKALFDRVRTDARNIQEKYIDPPATTDFAILFLPTEGLFAEVIRDPELTERLRREFSVTVCGPSTITAFLNSLQMGFRTLAIEKRSSEVWSTLGQVKTEFGKFETTLGKVQKNLEASHKELDELVGTRTRAINRRLKEVEAISSDSALFDGKYNDESEENL